MELFFDTETSDLPNKNLKPDDPDQAWAMQIGGILSTRDKIYAEFNFLVQSEGRTCSSGAQKVHGITVEQCDEGGLLSSTATIVFNNLVYLADRLVCHNFSFDIKLIDFLYTRAGIPLIERKYAYCTMKKSTNLLKLPGKFGKYKWPKLEELHRFLFGEDFEGAHDALADVRATRRCYYELIERGIV